MSTLAIASTLAVFAIQDRFAEAVKWFRAAAEQGNALAQNNLAFMFDNGQGVTQNHVEAGRLYKLTAAQGNAVAQNNLCRMYAVGSGVTQNYVYAYMWFNIASTLGFEEASNNQNAVSEQMTASDISNAQLLARECIKKNYKGC